MEIEGLTMDHLDALDWEILNATADDWENLEQIERALPGGLTNLETVTGRILRLVASGLLQARFEATDAARPTGLIDRTEVCTAWFTMTANGRAAWASSEHAAEV
jgi:hypothetical protein